ncbi:MAG: glycosyltransferase family 4 protein [Pseudomonadota bacterium]
MYKVLFITSLDLSGASGGSVATKSVIQAFSKRNDIDLTLMAPEPSGSKVNLAALNLLAWEKLPQRVNRSVLWNIKISFLVWYKLRTILKLLKPDFVVVRYGFFFLPSILFFPSHSTRLCLLIRGRLSLNFQGIAGRIVDLIHRSVLLIPIGNKADKILLAFEAIKQLMPSRIPSKYIKVIPNGAEIDNFPMLSINLSRKLLADKKDIHLEGLVIGFVGGMQKRHQLHQLIYALAEHSINGFSYSVLMVGDGPLKKEIEKLSLELGVSGNVYFTGAVPHGDIHIYISACNLLYGVVSQDEASNPIKIYEYLALGRKVVTSPTPEFQFIEKEKFGIFVKENTVSLIAQAIRDGFDLDWKEEDEQKARKYIEKNHTWDMIPKEIIDT